jgi:hypothetical protein
MSPPPQPAEGLLKKAESSRLTPRLLRAVADSLEAGNVPQLYALEIVHCLSARVHRAIATGRRPHDASVELSQGMAHLLALPVVASAPGPLLVPSIIAIGNRRAGKRSPPSSGV